MQTLVGAMQMRTLQRGGQDQLHNGAAVLSIFGGDKPAQNDIPPVKTNAVADDSPRNSEDGDMEMTAVNNEDQKLPDVTV